MEINLVLNRLGLHQNAYNQHFFTGFVVNLSNPAVTPSLICLTLCLYADSFVYFSEDPAVEEKFQHLLKEQITVEIMGTVEWFLGTHFQLLLTPSTVEVHLSQTGFAAHLVEDINIHLQNMAPNATPYCSGLPINAIPESDKDDNSPKFKECKQKYQSVVGSIGWLAQRTRPDLAPSLSFISAYSNKPSHSHWNPALYTLHYIHLTIDYGISFMSTEKAPLHTYMHFPHSLDTEAYVDALSPKPSQHHQLTTYIMPIGVLKLVTRFG
jgi:hypothetical protein